MHSLPDQIKTGALIGTDTATVYAIAPEQLYRLIKDKRWEMYAGVEWEGSPTYTDPSEEMNKLVRLYGGLVFFMGRDGFWEVTAPMARQEYGYLRPYGDRRKIAATGRIIISPDQLRRFSRDAGEVMHFFNYRTASAKDGKKVGDGTGVGLFIPLPDELSAQFPSLGSKDKSPPHATFLYVGNVPTDKETDFISVIAPLFAQFRGSVKGRLGDIDYFVHPEKEQRVAHLSVRFSVDMSSLRWNIRDALMAAGFDVQDSFPLVYRPHVTLAYLDGLDARFDGVLPHGSWEFNGLEVWGMSKVYEVGFGMKVASTSLRSLWGKTMQAGSGDVLQAIKTHADDIASLRDEILLHRTTIEALIRAGEARRLGRTGGIQAATINYDGHAIWARIRGTSGLYDTRITVLPKRGHHCTCPDWERNGQTIGPCKHVLALGQTWLHSHVEPAFNAINEQLELLEAQLETVLERVGMAWGV